MTKIKQLRAEFRRGNVLRRPIKRNNMYKKLIDGDAQTLEDLDTLLGAVTEIKPHKNSNRRINQLLSELLEVPQPQKKQSGE